MFSLKSLQKLCQLIRYDILTSTTTAGSGHPTTSLSAVELMATLFFAESDSVDSFFRYDLKNPQNIFNDRVIFSKGHGAPLLYALYHAAGAISYEELMSLRKFGSVIEGHPTPRWPYVDVATGSLGQGLSVGVGMAMGMKLRITNYGLRIKREPRVFVLLGDSEMAEGQVWEAIQLASYYKLNNLVGILDVNRLGQRGETMLGWDINLYAERIEAFGWKTILIDDGHDLKKVYEVFNNTITISQNTPEVLKPTMIVAKTIKGKGVSFLENKDGWHGKPVPKDMLETALKELGDVNFNVRGKIVEPETDRNLLKLIETNCEQKTTSFNQFQLISTNFKRGQLYSTREAYGDALVELGKANENIIVLDAETSNSTYAEKFKKMFPDRFIEMFIAEQNMVSVALGISKIGFIPFVSSFAAFLTRGFDQMRIAQYSKPNIKITGSHAGVSIGEDGPSQMALEDLAMARSFLHSIVLYPADAVSTIKLTCQMCQYEGMIFLRTTREKTPVIYDSDEEFEIGGSKIHMNTSEVFANKTTTSEVLKPQALIIAAGITLHEALKAQKLLAEQNINVVVMDCYSIKPIDVQSINRLVSEIKNVIVIEDHYPYGGLGEAVMQVLLANSQFSIFNFQFRHLCVRKIPTSGKPAELLHYEEIDAEAIVKAVKTIS